MIVQKALTYYRLKEDQNGISLLKMDLLKEAAHTYNVPISVLRRRVEDELVTDEGQGEGTDLSKESEEILVKRLPKKESERKRERKKRAKLAWKTKMSETQMS